MNSIKDLQPKEIWQNFYKLTQVPRPSNHEEKARKFMLEWAEENPGNGKSERRHFARSPGYGSSEK